MEPLLFLTALCVTNTRGRKTLYLITRHTIRWR